MSILVVSVSPSYDPSRRQLSVAPTPKYDLLQTETDGYFKKEVIGKRDDLFVVFGTGNAARRHQFIANLHQGGEESANGITPVFVPQMVYLTFFGRTG